MNTDVIEALEVVKHEKSLIQAQATVLPESSGPACSPDLARKVPIRRGQRLEETPAMTSVVIGLKKDTVRTAGIAGFHPFTLTKTLKVRRNEVTKEIPRKTRLKSIPIGRIGTRRTWPTKTNFCWRKSVSCYKNNSKR